MSAGLIAIPTESDNSLGVDKQDIGAPADLLHYANAAEWNTLKKTAKILADRMGLGDGSQAGTLEAIARAVCAPSAGMLSIVEDFFHLNTDAWLKTEASGGTVTVGGVSDWQGGSKPVAGLAKLTATGASAIAGLFDQSLSIDPWMRPRMKARIKTPASLTDSQFYIGMVNARPYASATRSCIMQPNSTGWLCEAQGSAADTYATYGSAPSASTWYDIEIQLDAAQNAGGAVDVRFYVDGALIRTISVVDSAPVGATMLGRWFENVRASGSGGTAYVDYCEIIGTRR